MSRSGSRSKLVASASSRAQKKNKGGKSTEPEEDEGPTELEVPQLEWSIISENVTKELAGFEVEQVAKKLSEVLSLHHHEEDLREAAQLDFFVSGYWFAAREKRFTDQQISAFFTVLHTLLDNLKTKGLSLVENIQSFKELVAGVGLPPSATLGNPLKCFTTETSVITLKYLQSTIFQHYSLLQHLFTEDQQEETITQKLYIEVPPDPSSLCPPPLEDAVTFDLYNRCIAPQPAPPDEHEQNTDQVHIDKNHLNEDVDSSQLLNVSADDLRTVMESVAKTTLTNYQDEVTQKLKRKEEAMLNRLSKLEKSLA